MNNTHDYVPVAILPATALFQLTGSESLLNSL